MTRTPEDLRETFARHADVPKDSTARLQVVVNRLAERRTGRGMHRRKSAPLLVSAAVVAVIAIAVVLASNHRTAQTQGLAGAGGATSTSIFASPIPFALTPVAGKTDYTFPINQRQVLQPVAGPRLGGNGATLRLSDFLGKVVVINVWASWCAPCRSEIPPLKAAYAQLAPAGVQFLGVDIKDNAAGAEAAGIPYPSIFDPAQKILLGLPVGSVPITVVLDKQHRVAHLWLREITQGALTDVVRAILAES